MILITFGTCFTPIRTYSGYTHQHPWSTTVYNDTCAMCSFSSCQSPLCTSSTSLSTYLDNHHDDWTVYWSSPTEYTIGSVKVGCCIRTERNQVAGTHVLINDRPATTQLCIYVCTEYDYSSHVCRCQVRNTQNLPLLSNIENSHQRTPILSHV